jgi:uncharacterized protein YecE (DUF72 family)
MNIGTALWTIPNAEIKSFPIGGSHLERYSQVFNAVEINTSFSMEHLGKTYIKWAAMTPFDFKLSVKLNKRFTHGCDLIVSAMDLLSSLESISNLGEKWKVLVVEIPSTQNFNPERVEKIYKIIRSFFHGMVALEIRNLTWMNPVAINLMQEYAITKVCANPEKYPGTIGTPGSYYRLHGNKKMGNLSYSESELVDLFNKVISTDNEAWCIFTNTKMGYAITNALMMKAIEKEREKVIISDPFIKEDNQLI